MGKLLFVWFKEPTGIPDGGTLANQRNFRLMQDIFGKDNVDSFYVHPKDEVRSLPRLMRSAIGFARNLHNGLTPKMIDDILKKSADYKYVFLCTSLFGIIAKALKEHGYKGTVISHFHNVESIYYDASVSKWLIGRSLIVKCAAQNDEWSCRYADIVIALNNRDKDILEGKYHRKVDVILPISFADKYHNVKSDAMTATVPMCVFIGSYFGPNKEGILWFVKNVLPKVNIRLRIVGKDMDKLKGKLANTGGVEIYSNVPDLATHFEAADFIIMPIFSGSGMKVKTCESLMYGKNIIGTEEAFTGYDIDTAKAGACCNTAEEFVRAIDGFCKSPVKRLNEYSRNAFLKNYTYEAVLEKARSLFH